MSNFGEKLREVILPTIVVAGGIILLLVIVATWIIDMDKCHQKKGVLVNTFFGYECVEPKK